jgi:hypothetical protein
MNQFLQVLPVVVIGCNQEEGERVTLQPWIFISVKQVSFWDRDSKMKEENEHQFSPMVFGAGFQMSGHLPYRNLLPNFSPIPRSMWELWISMVEPDLHPRDRDLLPGP